MSSLLWTVWSPLAAAVASRPSPGLAHAPVDSCTWEYKEGFPLLLVVYSHLPRRRVHCRHRRRRWSLGNFLNFGFWRSHWVFLHFSYLNNPLICSRIEGYSLLRWCVAGEHHLVWRRIETPTKEDLSEIGFLCVALGALELSIDQVGLDQISACLCQVKGSKERPLSTLNFSLCYTCK